MSSTTTAQSADDGVLRRVRSTGDMPRQPERLLLTNERPTPTNGTQLAAPVLTVSRIFTEPQLPQNEDQDADPQNTFTLLRFLAYFGLGRKATQDRKMKAALLWSFSWSFVQIVTITTVIALTGTRFKSPLDPTVSEWNACDRPLGAWACLWIFRVILSTLLAYWEYVRERAALMAYLNGEASILRRGNRTVNVNPRGGSGQLSLLPIAQQGTIVPPPNAAYTRLSVFASLITLSWFLTAHILEYTSINTCRYSSPHLWWLIFGILCIMYMMVTEVILIGFVVLVVTPIVFVFWNILLICLGRHPIQNPHIIKPDIDKLPKSIVEKIPLVMYIPPPPEGSDLHPSSPKIISDPHSYPPQGPVKKMAIKPKARFRFIRLRKKKQKGEESNEVNKTSGDVEKNAGVVGPLTWSDYWEDTEYPFVVLEGNRAACAICLMDFEEPKRKPGLEFPLGQDKDMPDCNDGVETETPVIPSGSAGDSVKEANAKEASNEEILHNGLNSDAIMVENRSTPGAGLHLEDAGEVAQPLRLLTCGHVFHKTCLDPWLIDVSGRCPVCQKAVEIPGDGMGKRIRQRPPPRIGT